MVVGDHDRWHRQAREMVMVAMRAAKGDREAAARHVDASQRTLERALTALALRPLVDREGLRGVGGRPATESGCPACEALTAEALSRE